jgi:hypothetical protein
MSELAGFPAASQPQGSSPWLRRDAPVLYHEQTGCTQSGRLPTAVWFTKPVPHGAMAACLRLALRWPPATRLPDAGVAIPACLRLALRSRLPLALRSGLPLAHFRLPLPHGTALPPAAGRNSRLPPTYLRPALVVAGALETPRLCAPGLSVVKDWGVSTEMLWPAGATPLPGLRSCWRPALVVAGGSYPLPGKLSNTLNVSSISNGV